MIPLRQYQQEAVSNVATAFAENNERLMLIAPTGSGKTVMASHMIQRMVARGHKILFVAHRRELILQARAKLEEFGVHAGPIMAGFKPEPWEPVQVGSVQTIGQRVLSFNPDWVVIDEAHHATSPGYASLLAAPRVIGMTATPFRLDGQGLADIFPRHVLVRTPRQLRDEGFLCPVRGWIYRSLDTTDVASRGGDYIQSQLAHVANTILGDVVAEWLKHFRERPVPTILFAAGVDHSKQFVAAFQRAGIAAEHIDGETPTAERDAILQRVRDGITTILSNCNVATEGFDLPALTCCILARPTKSLAMYLQMVGRVLRTAPGKSHAVIHDHANCLMLHGTPYDESREYIPLRSKQRVEREAGIVRCPQCGCVSDETPCAECGYAVPRPPRTPTVDLNVTAVSIDDLAAEQQALTVGRGQQTFQRVGQQLVGVLDRYEQTEGLYGIAHRYHFEAGWYIDAGADLHPKLRPIPPGTRVRIVYRGTETTARGYKKKLHSVYVPQQLPMVSGKC